MLLVCVPNHQNLDNEIFSVRTTIAGITFWLLKLLKMDPVACWVQMNQQVSLGASEIHVT